MRSPRLHCDLAEPSIACRLPSSHRELLEEDDRCPLHCTCRSSTAPDLPPTELKDKQKCACTYSDTQRYIYI